MQGGFIVTILNWLILYIGEIAPAIFSPQTPSLPPFKQLQEVSLF
jgi:hypothetical protein